MKFINKQVDWARGFLSESNGKASSHRLVQMAYAACVLYVFVKDRTIDTEMLLGLFAAMGFSIARRFAEGKESGSKPAPTPATGS